MKPLDCDAARPLLAPYADGEVDALQSAALERHLATCEVCSAALDSARVLREAVGRRAPYHRAPPGLLDRIAQQTSRAAPAPSPARTRTVRPWAWQRWVLPLAASLVLAIGIDSGLRVRQSGNRLAGEVLDAHVRSLMADHLADVPSTDQHTVKPWFADKLDFSPPVRDLGNDGFPLVGGRLDYIDHHAVAALIYRHRLHVINVFIWPAANDIVSSPSKLAREGFNLVRWRAAGMDFWAVSDLNAEELDQFARLLQAGIS